MHKTVMKPIKKAVKQIACIDIHACMCVFVRERETNTRQHQRNDPSTNKNHSLQPSCSLDPCFGAPTARRFLPQSLQTLIVPLIDTSFCWWYVVEHNQLLTVFGSLRSVLFCSVCTSRRSAAINRLADPIAAPATTTRPNKVAFVGVVCSRTSLFVAGCAGSCHWKRREKSENMSRSNHDADEL